MAWTPPWRRKRLQVRVPPIISLGSLMVGLIILWARWFYLHPSNPALGPALSLTADFAPMVIAIVGIIMSYRTPKKEHHLRTTLILILCGFIGTGVLSWVRIRNEAAHKTEMGELNNKLQTVAAQNAKILTGLVSGKPSAPSKQEPTVAPKPSETSRRTNVLSALRNEYILSHDNLSPALLAGTEQPPMDWVNDRLKQLGEKWALKEPTVGVKHWEILPFAVGQSAKARLHYTDVDKTRHVKVLFYAGMAPDLTSDYAARSALEDTLWSRIQSTDNFVLEIVAQSDNNALIEDSSTKLTQALIDKLGNGFVYYFMAIVTSEDGSAVDSCILAGKDPLPAYNYSIGHN